MPYSVAGVKASFSVFSLLIAGIIALITSATVSAEDTTINLAVCGSGAGATLTIDLPINDSVVDQPTVQVSGTVSNASQIDVSVDSQYYATVPLSPGQGSYTTPVQLTAGTHTISLVANDVCQVQDGNDSVVITYQPQSDPGTGGSTPTEVGDGSGAIITTNPVESDPDERTGIATWPVIGPLIRIGHGIAVALDFEIEARPGTLWQSMARFSFIVVGIAITFFGNIAISVWGWTRRPLSPVKQWGLRSLGIVVLVIAFLI